MKQFPFPAALVLTLSAAAHAQTTLTAAQVQVFERLMVSAKATDPAYNRARAAELEGRAQAGPLGAVSASAGLSVGTSPATENNVGGFDQITPAVRLSANVDLPALFASMTGQNQPRLDALAAAREGEARSLRARVLEAYTGYLSARRAVQQAGDGLEVTQAQVRVTQARAQAGAATGVDVLQVRQRVNAAKADVYDANRFI